VFDLTAKHSLKAAESWILELQKQGEDSLVIALAGNKADLKNKAEISEQDVNNLRAKYPKIEIYKETSAKTGANVKEIFEALAEEYLKIQANRRPSDAVDDLIASLEAKQKKDRNCCK
jgi:Ras-related protein Rab-5C